MVQLILNGEVFDSITMSMLPPIGTSLAYKSFRKKLIPGKEYHDYVFKVIDIETEIEQSWNNQHQIVYKLIVQQIHKQSFVYE